MLRCSVVSNSLWRHELQPTRLLCPWNSPGKNTGVGCHFILQGIFPTQGLNSRLLHLRHWQADSFPPVPCGKPIFISLYVSLICLISLLLSVSLFGILHILFQLVSVKRHMFFGSFSLVQSIQNIFLCFELVLSMEIVSYLAIYLCHIILFIFCYFVVTPRGGDLSFSELFLISGLSLYPGSPVPLLLWPPPSSPFFLCRWLGGLCTSWWISVYHSFPVRWISIYFLLVTSISICRIDCPLLPTGPCYSPPPSITEERRHICVYCPWTLCACCVESVSGQSVMTHPYINLTV